MPCWAPLEGYKRRTGGITFRRSESIGQKMTVPCGQCTGCKITKSKEWAIRCVHEQQMHTENDFITLTYNNENLPQYGSLMKHHFQDFMKRLRRSIEPKKVRFFMCGEYGEQFARPHYHAIIFGHSFSDRIHFNTINGQKLYISETLDDLWRKGYCSVGNVTFESCAYVARYLMKKINGDRAEWHYQKPDPETGELHPITPEYCNMSTGHREAGHGIGGSWYDKYKADVFPDDFVLDPKKSKIKTPTYYRKRYEISNPQEALILKKRRTAQAKLNKDNTPERLKARAKCLEIKLRRLRRPLEIKTDDSQNIHHSRPAS